jgi:predicted nucleic acid-binding protein
MPGRSAKFFLDTNILVYTFDLSVPLRRAQARELVERALTTRQGLISYQVVQEFLNVALRKFDVPLTATDCRQYLEQVLVPLWRISPTAVLYRAALDIQEQSGYGFYDSLIVASALDARCRTLYSPDLQDGREFGALTVVDPFAA